MVTGVRIAVVTTSYPTQPGDPAGHFVQTEAAILAREAEVVVFTAQVRSQAEPAATTGPPNPRVVALDGGDAFGWPGVAARLRERPARIVGLARWVVAARAALRRSGPFDRIVAHWALPSAWPIARELPGRLEIVSHGGDVRALIALPAPIRTRIVESLAARAAGWRFVSASLQEQLERTLDPETRLALRAVARVEPCAIELVDVRDAVARRRADFAGRPLYVCVARLVESKRIDRVIAHVAECPEPTTLVVVGDGPAREGLELLAARRGVDARFVGKTTHPEALTWIGAADALLHASEAEGLSTILREARALGTRVVTLTLCTLLLALLGCTSPSPAPAPAPSPAPSPALSLALAPSPAPSLSPPPRAQLHGHDFPDRVLALTWDDGPDLDTLELARYLAQEHIAATFFVVDAWVSGVSSDPGSGTHVYQTGAAALPILGDLVRLGHRIGNHTKNHVLLGTAPASVVVEQLADDQRAIDPFVAAEWRLFRAPGGAWSADASAAVDADPILRTLLGPIAWDVDERDWDGSLACTSKSPALECEPAAPGNRSRVKPATMAARYAASIDDAGHGIVLLHDRVGHVGSHYAIDLARALVPRLQARGYVFAAPVLRFSPPTPRVDVSVGTEGWIGNGTPLQGDLNGDGRPDRCERTPDGISCALAAARGFTGSSAWARFDAEGAPFAGSGALRLADVNGDGRADLCALDHGAVVCGLAP